MKFQKVTKSEFTIKNKDNHIPKYPAFSTGVDHFSNENYIQVNIYLSDLKHLFISDDFKINSI